MDVIEILPGKLGFAGVNPDGGKVSVPGKFGLCDVKIGESVGPPPGIPLT